MEILSAGHIESADPQVFEAIRDEERRQRENLELIASENYASKAVREAMGCVMTNKYAEGYPGKRYYGGCEYVDVVENLAIERLKAIFGADHANVQAHAGAQANMAVFMAVLQPGDTVLGMSLAREHKPKMISAGASAYPRTMEYAPFREICEEIGAVFMVDMAHIAGLVAADLHPSPVPFADFVTSTTHKTLRGPRGGLVVCKQQWAQALDKSVFPGIQGGPFMHMIAAKAVAFGEALAPQFKTYQQQVVRNAKVMAEEFARGGLRLVAGGTDTHLMLVDVSVKGLTGKAVEGYLDEIGITVNKNAIPYDSQKPMVASGIRIGTPAITTRGFGEDECREVARIIVEGLGDTGAREKIDLLRGRVRELTSRFDVP